MLLLVGTFEPFDEGQARAAGADSFLKKPFDSQELLQRVEELIAAKAPSPPPRRSDAHRRGAWWPSRRRRRRLHGASRRRPGPASPAPATPD